jgi:hypothetical protein
MASGPRDYLPKHTDVPDLDGPRLDRKTAEPVQIGG